MQRLGGAAGGTAGGTAKRRTGLAPVAALLLGGLLGAGLPVGSAARAAPQGAAPSASQGPSLASLPGRSAPAQALGEARPVIAWTVFCQRYPGECAVDRTEATTIALTPAAWGLITAINRRVNGSLRPITDQEHWGQPDVWDLAEDGSGDCEDYQLLKRHLLAAAGLPRRAMRMTVVIDEKGEGHAVLMLRTDRGDLILDNKTDAILAWHQTGYTYVKRESQDATAWVSLGGATAPVATANR